MTKGSKARHRLPLLLTLFVAVVGVTSIMVPRGDAAPRLLGTVLPNRPAPGFQLWDQWGHTQSLRRWRGHPVLLLFTQSTCTTLCPVVAETIRRAIAELGSASRPVTVLAVSTDPEHDTPGAVRRFLRNHNALQRWYYLTASRARLRSTWDAYHLYVAPANARPEVVQSHTSAVYLIDSVGHERVLMAGDPVTADLETDLRVFLGLSARAGGVAVAAPEVDHSAPPLELPTLQGRPVALATLRGQVVVLNFWATWCTACQSEIPRLSSWYRRMYRQGITVLGIDAQESRAVVQRYANSHHIHYPVLLDQSGAVVARYDVVGLPKSLVIDQQGVVRWVKLGGLTHGDLVAHAQSLSPSVR